MVNNTITLVNAHVPNHLLHNYGKCEHYSSLSLCNAPNPNKKNIVSALGLGLGFRLGLGLLQKFFIFVSSC